MFWFNSTVSILRRWSILQMLCVEWQSCWRWLSQPWWRGSSRACAKWRTGAWAGPHPAAAAFSLWTCFSISSAAATIETSEQVQLSESLGIILIRELFWMRDTLLLWYTALYYLRPVFCSFVIPIAFPFSLCTGSYIAHRQSYILVIPLNVTLYAAVW